MIVLKNVCKNFDDLEVLKGVSIEIQDHEVYGIIGQSGAGKYTLLR
jgi:D-methionine transport system ATP-binding protein